MEGARKSGNPSPSLRQAFANPSPTLRQPFLPTLCFNLFCQPLSKPLFPWAPGTRLGTRVNGFFNGRWPIRAKRLAKRPDWSKTCGLYPDMLSGRQEGGFVKGWFWRMCPRSGFRSGGHANVPSFRFSFRKNSECTLVPVFLTVREPSPSP